MILLIIISVLLVTLLWILFGPVIIRVDTEDQHYYINLPGILKAAVIPTDILFKIRMRVFFIPFSFDPFAPRKRKPRERKPEKRRKRRMSLSKGSGMFRDMLGAFRIRRLRLDVDTDDEVLNAFLIPAFTAVNSEHIQLSANFEGRALLQMDMRTRLGSLAWVFLKNNYTSKSNR
jgi:hypothetical protein